MKYKNLAVKSACITLLVASTISLNGCSKSEQASKIIKTDNPLKGTIIVSINDSDRPIFVQEIIVGKLNKYRCYYDPIGDIIYTDIRQINDNDIVRVDSIDMIGTVQEFATPEEKTEILSGMSTEKQVEIMDSVLDRAALVLAESKAESKTK